MLHSLTLDRSRVFSWRSHLDSHSSTSPLMCNTITIVHEFEFLIDRRFTLCRPVSGTFVEFCQLISFVCNNNVCAVSLRTARSNGITFYPCGFNGTRVLCRIYVRFTATHARIGNYFLLSSRWLCKRGGRFTGMCPTCVFLTIPRSNLRATYLLRNYIYIYYSDKKKYSHIQSHFTQPEIP